MGLPLRAVRIASDYNKLTYFQNIFGKLTKISRRNNVQNTTIN